MELHLLIYDLISYLKLIWTQDWDLELSSSQNKQQSSIMSITFIVTFMFERDPDPDLCQNANIYSLM